MTGESLLKKQNPIVAHLSGFFNVRSMSVSFMKSGFCVMCRRNGMRYNVLITYLTDVTSQPLATAYLQIRDPKKPLPPQTISFLAAADMATVG
jgi:hypothetical protein